MGGGRQAKAGAWSVVLVDDDDAAAEMYRMGLQASHFEVRIARDVEGLFAALEHAIPDILVLDWLLPGVRGDEILERVRIDERTRALPVFMLSNFPAEKDGVIDRVFLAGALAWLEKSKTTPATLAERLAEALVALRRS